LAVYSSSHLAADGKLVRAGSAAFTNPDGFSVYLANYANLEAILKHFGGFSVAELLTRLRELGFEIIVSESTHIAEPHADALPPKGMSRNQLTKLVKRQLLSKVRLVHVDPESAKFARRVLDAANDA